MREAIFEHIDDLEDRFLAEARARKSRKTIPLEDVESELGLAESMPSEGRGPENLVMPVADTISTSASIAP